MHKQTTQSKKWLNYFLYSIVRDVCIKKKQEVNISEILWQRYFASCVKIECLLFDYCMKVNQ